MSASFAGPDRTDPLGTLTALEQALDPAHPERTPGLRVLGYGEASVALTLTPLPGRVAKRMAGFRDQAAAETYTALVSDYVRLLRETGVCVVDTEGVAVPRRSRAPVAYLLQTRLDSARLGHRLARDRDPGVLLGVLTRILRVVGEVFTASPASTADAIAVDAQLSNWWFADPSPTAASPPVLVDVGTPFLRRNGAYAMDFEVLLAAGPPPVRPVFRQARILERYFDDYFDPRTVAVDLLCNLHKEGVGERIDLCLPTVNAWLTEHADAFGKTAPVTRTEVDRYYRSDARLLELFLVLRRLDRLVRHGLLGRPYDFVLPGAIRR